MRGTAGRSACSSSSERPAGPDAARAAILRPVEPPTRPLRLLHLEDSEPDHALVVAQLERSGLRVQVHRVETRDEFEAALAGSWDAVLSDFSLPGFGGLEALEMVVASGRGLPFVLVSGEIGEDTAVAAMRKGADDYLLKNRLARLAPALEHAIAARREQRGRERADRELALSQRRLRELAQHLQSGIEMERSAIAREIHDDVGGSLTALKFELDWIRRHAGDEPVRQRALAALDTVSQALEASQRIMHNLRPAILEQGLVAALQWLARRFEQRTGVPCRFQCSPPALAAVGAAPLDLPPGVALTAYRTAQEALTNVAKHARARKVDLDLSVALGVLSLEIGDDGQGLREGDLSKAGSFGIRGLHERASTVGGWVDLSSHARGTTLILSVPLAAGGEGACAVPGGGVDNRSHDPSTWAT